jgi:hypothetical protein
VSFPDDVKLSELSVLNPEWATDGIYRVMTNEPLREKQQGLLTRNALRRLLPKDRWPKPKHVQYVLSLMEKFHLCFPVGDGTDTVLVPEILPDKTPPLTDWDPAECVVFLYKYPVLPHGVLPRFITCTHTLSEGCRRWRSGVELQDDGAEALIKADYDASEISVWVRGQYADSRRGLLKIVRHHFEQIHARIKDLDPTEVVAFRGYPEVLLPYRDLILDERRGKDTVPVTIFDERVDRPIKDFLDCVESAATRRQESQRHEKNRRDIYVASGGIHYEYHETMKQDSHDIHINGDVYGQVGQTLENCTNMIQQHPPGERRDFLEALEREVKELISILPKEKEDDAPQVANNLEQMVNQATARKPNRRWYEVSAEGLLEASKWVKDFSGNIVGTIGGLGKLLWPNFSLPKKRR